MILSVDKSGKLEWSRVIHKDQYDDDNENFFIFFYNETAAGKFTFYLMMIKIKTRSSPITALPHPA